jgi:hypothetical protein
MAEEADDHLGVTFEAEVVIGRTGYGGVARLHPS